MGLLKSLLDLHFDRQNNRYQRQFHQPKGGLPVDFIGYNGLLNKNSHYNRCIHLLP